jgi:hypothetical protein
MNFIGSPRALGGQPEDLMSNLFREIDLRLGRLEGAYSGAYNPGVSVMAVRTVADLPPDHSPGQVGLALDTGVVYTSEDGGVGLPRVWQPGGTLPTW